MTRPDDPLRPEFEIRAGRRGSLTLAAAAWAAIAIIAGVALAVAISRPTADGQGGAGNVVLPALGAVLALLALVYTLGQWWDDATRFQVVGDRLEVRHGGRWLRGRAERYSLRAPVLLIAEGPRDAMRLFIEQDRRRVNLGGAEALGTDQVRDWESWMRAHGGRVVRHDDRFRSW